MNKEAIPSKPENRSFWDELCGTGLFKFLNLNPSDPGSLKIFDDYYFEMYPYLKTYVSDNYIIGQEVLEIGLGYGSLGQYLASRANRYVGIDYADNPVSMMNDRIRRIGFESTASAFQGDARKLNLENDSFNSVISIGCLHHTGDTSKSIQEIYRVLKPGGHAVIMLYNKYSFRRMISNPYRYYILRNRLGYSSFEEYSKASCDTNAKGEAAPIIDFYSRRDVHKLFSEFQSVRIQSENFDNFDFKPFDFEFIPWNNLFKPLKRFRVVWPRTLFLKNLARIWGLDLYIIARK